MDNRFSDNNQVGVVSTFAELVNTDFQGNMNALCWNRSLEGDFEEIVSVAIKGKYYRSFRR